MDDRGETEFDAFVAARWGALVRTAYLLTGDHHLAEDLVQSALVKAAGSWSRIAVSPEAYVRRIIYTQNVSWWRRRRHLRETDLADHDGAARQDDSDTRLALVAALRRLTPRQRAVLVLRFLEDRSEADAAALLRVSRGTVKSTTHLALSRLRTLAPELAELIGTEERR